MTNQFQVQDFDVQFREDPSIESLNKLTKVHLFRLVEAFEIEGVASSANKPEILASVVAYYVSEKVLPLTALTLLHGNLKGISGEQQVVLAQLELEKHKMEMEMQLDKNKMEMEMELAKAKLEIEGKVRIAELEQRNEISDLQIRCDKICQIGPKV
jgi:hypothetical protein